MPSTSYPTHSEVLQGALGVGVLGHRGLLPLSNGAKGESGQTRHLWPNERHCVWERRLGLRQAGGYHLERRLPRLYIELGPVIWVGIVGKD